jgi:hypothetical protein
MNNFENIWKLIEDVQIAAERHNFGKQWAEMLEKKDYDSLKEAERAAEKAESICRYLRVALIWKAKERLELETQERLWKERTQKATTLKT